MIKDFAKVKDSPNLVRDRNTRAIVNTDSKAYEVYMSEKAFREQVMRQQQSTSMDINNVKQDIQELKSLIITLINQKQ